MEGKRNKLVGDKGDGRGENQLRRNLTEFLTENGRRRFPDEIAQNVGVQDVHQGGDFRLFAFRFPPGVLGKACHIRDVPGIIGQAAGRV